MEDYLQKMRFTDWINNRIRNDISLLIKLSCSLLAAFFLAGFFSYTVEAASGLKLYNYSTKKTTTYSDQQVKVTFNGTGIGSSKAPGILVDGIALLPYYDIFKKSEIAADCVYNSSKGTVTISKSGTTIVMTIGSKKATVNGKTITMNVAPMKVKYVLAGISRVLVPSRFVSETLGLGYTWNSAKGTVEIIKNSITLSYNGGAKFEYTGVQGMVTVDSKSISLGGMPSILTNNTAMLQAKKVFADSSIGATYSYNSKTKVIQLKKGSNVLFMTVGSTKATLNNKLVQMSAAPILVKNYDTNTSYVMVPGGFTAASLGYEYNWNNTTRTSMITSTSTTLSGNTTGSAPELGDSGNVSEPGTVLYTWNADSSYYAVGSSIHELAGTASKEGYLQSILRDYSSAKLNTETFMVTASVPFGKVKAVSSGNTITITANSLLSADQIYQMYGVSSNYINTISTTYDAASGSTNIVIALLQPNYTFDLSFSADQTILYITIYQNTVVSASVGTNSLGDYLTITGILPIKASLSVQSSYLIIDLPNTSLAFADVAADITGTSYIKQCYMYRTVDKIQILLNLAEGYSYYVMENGNQYTVFLQKKSASDSGNTGSTGTSSGSTGDTTGSTGASSGSTGASSGNTGDTSESTGNTSGNTEVPSGNTGTSDTNIIDIPTYVIPTVTDTSKYEIVVPLPAEITASAITHEDFYYNNYFVIRLQGNYTEYYKNNKISYTSSVISKVSVSLNSSNQTEIKVVTTKLQGYELALDEDNLYINVGNPKDIYPNIVLLDPGHGGAANGANYYGTKEKDVNFAILYTIGKKYFNSDPTKLKVYYTRTSDVDLALSSRAAYASTVGADLFVSLHMNAAEATVVGTEVFYSSKNNITNSAGLSSAMLASYFVTNITEDLGMDNRGVKKEDYTVIYKSPVPAVLIELGFLSTKSEHAKLADPAFQEEAAKTLYLTLLEAFADYPTGR